MDNFYRPFSQPTQTKGETIISKLVSGQFPNSEDIDYIRKAIRFSETYSDIFNNSTNRTTNNYNRIQ